MPKPVISVEHLTKKYDLGVIGTGSLTRDLNRWWARVRKQPDPYTRIGQEDAFKRFGQSILALDDVSFKVEQGEALGIIGRNGAGKSTLLKILSRVTAPTSGVVKVRGRIGSLLEVGTGFHPELTGRENVYLNGAILGMKKAEVTRKFDQIVDFSGVEKFIDTPVKRYSSGMYVRLAFAVAAHLDPEILIVDEVLAVGDAEFQKKCLGKMEDVTGEGRTVLFVSHNLEAVKTLCQRSLVLNGGQIQIDSDSVQAVSSYIERNTGSTYSANCENNEAAKITQIWLSNYKNVKKDSFSVGELLTVNIELVNPNKESVNIDLSFLNSGNIKLWNFSHEQLDLNPINKNSRSIIRYTFRVPHVNLSEIFFHVGLHKNGMTSPYYIDHIREGLRFSINENSKKENDKRTSLLNCPVEYEEIKIE